MKAISAEEHAALAGGASHREPVALSGLRKWINEQEPDWEDARITISGVGIFVQVTLAGIMIGVLSALGAPPLAYSTGILFAFVANSVAFCQTRMRWVLGLFAASCLVNLSLVLYFGIQFLIH